jgi:hypothetical protein
MIGPTTMALLERQASMAKMYARYTREHEQAGRYNFAAKRSRQQGDALRAMNSTFHAEGLQVGTEVKIGADIFRVTNFGCMAVHLGAVLPQDEDEQQAQRMTDWQELASNWSPQ